MIIRLISSLQPSSTGEQKTKPTQHSVRALRGLGLSPDLIVCRSQSPILSDVREKISNFCHVDPDQASCFSFFFSYCFFGTLGNRCPGCVFNLSRSVSARRTKHLLLLHQAAWTFKPPAEGDFIAMAKLGPQVRTSEIYCTIEIVNDYIFKQRTRVFFFMPKDAKSKHFYSNADQVIHLLLRYDRITSYCNIALVGKYTQLEDSYASVIIHVFT